MGTRAEGQDPLFSLTTGVGNTAHRVLMRSLATQSASLTRPSGWLALYSNTTGSGNAANENYGPSFFNTTGNNNTANGRQALL